MSGPGLLFPSGASLNMLVYSVCAIYIGRLLDKMAPRWIITCGALLAALSLILTSFVKTPLQFYLVYGLLLGAGSACMGVVVCNPSVSKWFIRKRGLAIGITTMGISFGTILLTPAAGFLVKDYGWQSGFLFLGAVTFVIGVSLSQLLLGKNPSGSLRNAAGRRKKTRPWSLKFNRNSITRQSCRCPGY